MFLEELDSYENGIIEKFRNHPVLDGIENLSDAQFRHMLVQKRFVSLSFTPLYDRAIDAIEDEEGKSLLRQLLREEYPKGRSHREDLAADLTKIGVAKREILASMPTRWTLDAIRSLFGMLIYQEEFYDIKILMSLRVAEELLVAEEYEIILAELKRRYGFNIDDSVFYGPHFLHDRKQKPFGVSGGSHTDGFNSVLARLIDTKEKCETAKRAMSAACEARLKFFDQFA